MTRKLLLGAAIFAFLLGLTMAGDISPPPTDPVIAQIDSIDGTAPAMTAMVPINNGTLPLAGELMSVLPNQVHDPGAIVAAVLTTYSADAKEDQGGLGRSCRSTALPRMTILLT